MPFKRAVVLLLPQGVVSTYHEEFQCPLSGQLCCCQTPDMNTPSVASFNAL